MSYKVKTFKIIFITLLIFTSCKKKQIISKKDILFIKINKIFKNYNDKNNTSYITSIYNKKKVNCDNIDSILNKILIDDQKYRISGAGDSHIIDSLNRVNVVSFLENCKQNIFEKKLSSNMYLAVFLTLQHSGDKDLMAYYYNDIEKMIVNNPQYTNTITLYTDRFLMLNNKKQIFGTQYKNGKLYNLEQPNSVNPRRRIMGLEDLTN